MIRFALFAGVWCSIAMLILSFSDVQGEWDHAVCGIWGCSPPLAAVATCQALWGLVLFPLAWWVSNRFSARISRITAITTLAVALFAFIAIVIYEVFNWLLFVAPESRKYFGHRLALATLAQVDFPVVMLLLSGLFLRWRVPDEGRITATPDR